MAEYEQILPISGPMVDSLDDEFVNSGGGVVLNRVNMRSDLTGRKGANVPVPGTILREVQIPEGTNKTLGWCRDSQNKAIIWCVYNSNGNHCVFRYFTGTKTTQKIFYAENSLGFSDNTEIAAEVIDGRFYWNDNTGSPKGFNINKAVNYTNGIAGSAYTSDDIPFDEKIFPFYKKPPRYAPTYVYESLTEFEGQTIDFNNLRKKQWQVKYCYVYEDFQESPYSPISKIVASKNEVSALGEWVNEITFNNALKISLDTGSNNVKQIKVAIRDASNLNTSPFYLFKTIDKFKDEQEIILSDSKHDVYFLNNVYLQNIDTERENAYYHNIPLQARDMLLIDGKYIGMSMPKTGYDFKNSDLDYSLDYVEHDTDFTVSGIKMASAYDKIAFFFKWYRCGLKGRGRIRIRITIPEKFQPNALYRVFFKTPETIENPVFSPVPLEKQPEVVASWTSPATEPSDFRKVAQEALIAELNSGIDACYSVPIRAYKDGDTGISIYWYMPYVGINIGNDPIWDWREAWDDLLSNYEDYIYGDIVVGGFTPVYNGLKRGQYHQFGIVYNDGFGRYNAVFGEDNLYIPPADISVSPDNTEKYYTPKITINSLPPEWAETFRLAYIPYGSYTYQQEVPGVEVIDGDIADNGVQSGYKFLKINQAILSIIDDFPDSKISAYVWQNGDRIRQVGYPDSYEVLQEFTRTYTSGTENVTETGYLVKADFVLTGSQIGLLEVYRPNLTPQDKVYYEIGEEYPVLNPGTQNRVHYGNSQEQTSTTPAILTPNFGDIYFRARFASEATAGYALVEDNHFSDYYTSNGINIGRSVIRIDLKQEISRKVIKTENYIENTEFNRINIIIPGDESFSVSEVYGDITKVIERGDTIKIIQPHRENSVYIGKNYAKDAAGGDIALDTTSVFGSPQYYEAFAGSEYRNSVIMGGSNIYYMDVMTADLYRSAVNGTISLPKKYGKNKYFEEICEAFRQYDGDKDIITGYESSNDVVYLSFIMGKTISTIAFSEDDNNKGFVFMVDFSNGDIIPELYADYGDYMYSFVGGQLYEHGTGDANRFYGSDRKSALVEIVANQHPQLRKTFEYMSVDADGEWSSDMAIEADDNYPSGQKTKILPKMFKSREGVKTSAVPRNILSSNGAENIQRLYSGNKMSGNSMRVSLESANFTTLRKVKVSSINQS